MVRVILILDPVMPVPKTSAGRRNIPRLPIGSFAKGISTIGGDQPHQMEGYIIIVPIQKLGTDIRMIAALRNI